MTEMVSPAEKAKRGEAVLKRVKALRALAAAHREEAARVREIASGTAAVWGGMRGSRPDGSRQERAALRLLELEESWAEAAAELAGEEARLARAFRRMDARACLLLHLRWLRGCTWAGTAMRLYVSERTARRMHAPALAEFFDAYEAEAADGGK